MIKQVRKFITIAAVSYFAASVPAVHAAEDTIRLGLQSVPTDVLYQAKDWAKPYELKTEISTFSSAGDSLKAFLAGRVDVVSGGAARLVSMAAMQPEKFYIVATNQYGGGRYGLMVAPTSPYKNIQDLKGKKIGVVGGSGSYGTFIMYLEKNKLGPKDFQLVNMKVEDIAAAVSRGVVDAGLAWEPQVAIAEVSNMVKRIASMEGISDSPNFILASRNYADAHPESLAKYIASLIDIAQLIETNSKEAGSLVSKQLEKSGVDIKPEAMALAFGRVTVDPKIEIRLLDELPPIAESMLSNGRIKAVPDFKVLVNTGFYDKAVALQKTANR